MPLKKWKKLSESLLYKNPWWEYRKDETLLPNDKKGEYHYVHTNGASMIIPVLDDGRFVMVNQYRYLNNKESLEFPCGGVKDGYKYEETAIKELQEETGFLAEKWAYIGEFNPYNGVTNEICKVYLASSLKPFKSTPDETEEFEILNLTASEIDMLVSNGFIWDGMTIVSWTLAKNKLEKLLRL